MVQIGKFLKIIKCLKKIFTYGGKQDTLVTTVMVCHHNSSYTFLLTFIYIVYGMHVGVFTPSPVREE